MKRIAQKRGTTAIQAPNGRMAGSVRLNTPKTTPVVVAAPDVVYSETVPQETEQPRWLTDAQQGAWRSWFYSGLSVVAGIDEDLLPHGVDLLDYHVLVVCSENDEDGARITDIAMSVLASKQRAGQRVKQMEARGLLTMSAGLEDKREKRIRLTESGMELLKSLAPGHVEDVRRRMIDLLTEEEIDMLTRISTKILKANEPKNA